MSNVGGDLAPLLFAYNLSPFFNIFVVGHRKKTTIKGTEV